MSVNRFSDPGIKKKISDSNISSVVVFVLVLVLLMAGLSIFSKTSARDDKANLQKAINRDIVHCYAVEGFYPPTLSYIEDNYGLSYNKARFLVDYEYVGTNVMPAVTIIERNGV